jgi:hypothetical protein
MRAIRLGDGNGGVKPPAFLCERDHAYLPAWKSPCPVTARFAWKAGCPALAAEVAKM